MERGVGTLASPLGCGETPAFGGQCPHLELIKARMKAEIGRRGRIGEVDTN